MTSSTKGPGHETMATGYRVGVLVLLVGLWCVLPSCATRTQHRELPPGTADLYVPPFENTSNEIGLENLLTASTRQQFLADGQVNLVGQKKQADVVLHGSIDGYARRALIFNPQDVVQQYRVRMTVRLELRDPRTGDTLRSLTRVQRQTTYSDRVPPIETEEEAQQRVIEQVARDVVDRTLRGWPYAASESSTSPSPQSFRES